MDLQTIREQLHAKKYQCREDFLQDIKQIVENSALYNGINQNSYIFTIKNWARLILLERGGVVSKILKTFIREHS